MLQEQRLDTATASILRLAPLQGITTRTFRRVLVSHFGGLDGAVSPFISLGGGTKVNQKKLKDILPEKEGFIPLVPQYLGHAAESFVAVARAVHDLGYDEINWNLGCPQPFIVKKRRGAGLLAHPDEIRTILDTCVPNLPAALSVKMRLGVENAAESLEVLRVLNDYPIRLITIHARTARQMYAGTADLKAFEHCMSITRHPVEYSGDIVDLATFGALRERFPALTRWMLGRGIVADPALAEALKAGVDNRATFLPRLRAFHDELLAAYTSELFGPVPVLGRMKEFWAHLAPSFRNKKRIIRKVRRAQRVEQYAEIVKAFFDSTPTWIGPPRPGSDVEPDTIPYAGTHKLHAKTRHRAK